MNFSFYILGTPNGYNQYPADNNSTDFQEFAYNNTKESQLTVCRKGQLVYYVYVRRLQDKSSDFLGFCIVFNGIYCRNPKKFFDLFERAFYDVQLKGHIMRFEKGKANYFISKFAERPLEIERIKTFFKNNLENDFTRDFIPLSPSFKVGNGKKNISIKENDIDILAAISEFDIVHIANNEKSLSELERTQKMLTDLYAEKQDLSQKYSKLLAQKKQYNVVLFLCLIVICCAIGLFAFNKDLQSKDSQISNLRENISQKEYEIRNLNANILLLENEKEQLTDENSQLSTKNNELTASNERLSTEIRDKNDAISNLESQNNSLQSKNRSLQSDVDKYKKYEPQTYYVKYKADFYYKYRCGDTYNETSCYTSAGNTATVYATNSSGYGLTEYGWVKMSNLSKY